MLPCAEIFSQGEEVVSGQTVDSNAAWLSQRLVQLGFRVTRHTAVGDKLDHLVALLREISERADCCICTGGLGPTLDDLTAEAVAQAFQLPLQFDAGAYAQIQRFFELRQRAMPASNRKQAMLPQGALRLDNALGTAPGFALQAQRCWFAFAPGVPSEMRHMFATTMEPLLRQRFSLRPAQLLTIKTFGIGESDIQQRIENIDIPGIIELGFRAGTDDVQTKLLFPPDYPRSAIQHLAAAVAAPLGAHVFAVDLDGSQPGDLAAAVDCLMRLHGKTLAAAESVSQGLLAAKCIGYNWLLESIYAPVLEKLCQKLGTEYRAGNTRQSAENAAQALRSASGAAYALLQWHDGDAGALAYADESITLRHCLASDDGCFQTHYLASGPLPRKQNYAALAGLDFLRRHLQSLPV